MTIAYDHRGPHIALECSLPSEVTTISPFVDKLMLLLRNCGCVPEGVSDVEIALREALANAIIHGNHEDRRKHVHVTCRCEPDQVSIAVKDEGSGFDINSVPNPTARENIGSVHGRGILVMKAVMDEVRFEEGGAVVHVFDNGDSQTPAALVVLLLPATAEGLVKLNQRQTLVELGLHQVEFG